MINASTILFSPAPFMIIAVAYIAKLATAGKETSIPPEMITIISNAAKIRVTSMERRS